MIGVMILVGRRGGVGGWMLVTMTPQLSSSFRYKIESHVIPTVEVVVCCPGAAGAGGDGV